MNFQVDLHKLALAGLLHDVGKLGHRAGDLAQRRRSHAALGEKFVTQCVPSAWQNALAPVAWHHGDPERQWKVEDPSVKLVALADRLSAGERERRDRDELEDHAVREQSQLISVFHHLHPPHPSPPRLLPLAPLTLKRKVLFPSEAWAPPELERAYGALWDGLQQEAVAVCRALEEGAGELEAYLETMLHLMFRYTWCVPSAYYYDKPDVSLYDHSRTTAALAVCLAKAVTHEKLDELFEAVRLKERLAWPDKPAVACLIRGDISGIQKFIYALHHPKGAAAVLRARSFYLQILSEVLARWMLQELGLPITNLLFCAGGHFTLLAPPPEEPRVHDLGKQVNGLLFRTHGANLYLALSSVSLGPKDFALGSGGLSQAEKLLGDELEKQKGKKFSELDENELGTLASPQGSGGGEENVCSVCGQEAPTLVEDEDGARWCPSCQAFRELGRDLRRAQFLRLSWGPRRDLPQNVHSWRDVLLALGAKVALSAKQPPPIPEDARLSTVFLLEDEAHCERVRPRDPREALARKFMVNVVASWGAEEAAGAPREAGEIKDFSDLAEHSKGAPYLGVLRMDMDNLGPMFREGLGARDSFSRRAHLSTALTLFFEGWVERIVQDLAQAEGRERLYSVYSGGDDLFFVGSWDAVLELARRIRSDFAQYTGRPELGISGGLVLVGSKFPLYVAAERAKEAEELAKGWRNGDREKDAFAFLSLALGWERFGYDDEGDTVAHWAQRFIGLVEGEEAAREVVRKIQDLYEQYKEGKAKGREWGPWIWRAAYWLARTQERTKEAMAKEALNQVEALLSGREFTRNIEWLAVAARWAELATRRRERP